MEPATDPAWVVWGWDQRLNVVGCNRLTDRALELLGRMPRLSALSFGPAPSMRFTDAGLAHLAGLSRLTKLELDSCSGITGT